MARTLIVFFLALSSALAAAPVRVIVDPALPVQEERVVLIEEARRCLECLRGILARPQARAHFRAHYGLDAVRVLERDDFAVIVRPFVPQRGPASVLVGAYEFGETTLDLNVAVLRAARRAPDAAPWRRYVAGLLVHELAHLADFLDDGVNDDGGLLGVEEGEAAQKACGCDLTPPGDLPDEATPGALTQGFWSPRQRATR